MKAQISSKKIGIVNVLGQAPKKEDIHKSQPSVNRKNFTTFGHKNAVCAW